MLGTSCCYTRYSQCYSISSVLLCHLAQLQTLICSFMFFFSCVFSAIHEIYIFYCTDHTCSIGLPHVLSSVLVDTSCKLSSNHIQHIAKCLYHASVCGLTGLIFLMKLRPQFCAMQKMSMDGLVYHFMVAKFRLKVKAFTAFVAF